MRGIFDNPFLDHLKCRLPLGKLRPRRIPLVGHRGEPNEWGAGQLRVDADLRREIAPARFQFADFRFDPVEFGTQLRDARGPFPPQQQFDQGSLHPGPQVLAHRAAFPLGRRIEARLAITLPRGLAPI